MQLHWYVCVDVLELQQLFGDSCITYPFQEHGTITQHSLELYVKLFGLNSLILFDSGPNCFGVSLSSQALLAYWMQAVRYLPTYLPCTCD